MISVGVKLYSLYRLDYKARELYDVIGGIALSFDTAPTVSDLLGRLSLDKAIFGFADINHTTVRDLDHIVSDGDSIGLHPVPPQGG